MCRASLVFCAGLHLLAVNASVAAAQSAEPVAIAISYAVMSNGDWYTGDFRSIPATYVYAGNLFAVAGRTPGTQHFIGAAGLETGAAYAITQGGDWYEFGTFLGNIPAIAGRSLGADEFTAMGASTSPAVGMGHFAITRAGDLFSTCATGWCFRGNIFGGSTPALSETWGGVKVRYRGERQPAAQDR